MSMPSYLRRRQQLLAQMQARGGGIAIIPTAYERVRNSDNFFPFRHDSYFYYLSGFTEPEALIVLIANGHEQRSILFCREKNLEREIWDGYRFGSAAAKAHFGFDASFAIDALDTEMPHLLADVPTLFYSTGNDTQLDSRLHNWIEAVRAKSRSGISAPDTTIDVRVLLDEMRLRKDASEVALMQKAANISGVAHTRAMQIAGAGRYEYELEAELHHEFRRQGSQAPAYGSIVATGANACVLHYSSNNALIKDGDLILIDAGCEFDSYASDITRTFPANGKFSSAQKTLYEIVLASQQAALDCARPGSRYMDGHNAAVKVLTQGMLDTGLLDKNKLGNVEDAINNLAFRQFYMHGTGHWLGLDVHDVGSYREADKVGDERPYRQLEPGMVITIEPGIYVRPAEGVPEEFWNIGIRIEDDILITPEGHLNLSRDTPKTVAEIESVMKR
ncbi:aminopeptidase P N-terminal domain-containing protein [Undibacterium sp. RTI2.1]|uniref:aminopeptidase P N-terminal domain-containing protein n=2 Tax=unclassified Undibacterium TaxID=2630295 RepID=UPI002AB57CB5|nr:MULTISPECIES: aminopeptidase P N-terminal domain-containing protein [unclassified Undibacterium]MDY7536660.1 aminopeptidase P N-terminal domain-containing protein [Undibacterium sp. 5I1]MEB0032360.1 aminopeptidase P N-terminal domain-containing protein [Undibacterium sp. RTI2.1]MEB0118458.1 aminopeptidase P N-terminal domain-containing protein [Undibacterium sp. RTI2.2]MEB0230295.1 aminopeptidase P N-terminal domain-containing protein [Undibacterium sp. 10I3]MEB0257995.1 aminopeptidase P N-